MSDLLSTFQMVQPVAPHEQIAAFLRAQVRSGALPVGARLPTTQQLARQWGVTVTVVQAAFAPLVREGLLSRRPRVGTVVRQRAPVIGRVGLYRISDAAREGTDHFSRRLAAVTAARLAAGGIAVEQFTDLRPAAERTVPPPDLLQAVRLGRLDAMIVCETEARANPWLARLPVPSSIFGALGLANAIAHDYGQFGREGIARLAARGCRSAGLVSVFPIGSAEADGSPGITRDLHAGFIAAAAGAGLATRPAWIRTPPRGVILPEAEAERFGYEAIRAMCADGGCPDGIVVFTDLVARGVIMGLMALGEAGRPRLVLHRNVELGVFCPFPADHLDVSLVGLADLLIDRLARQHRGEALAWMQVPFTVCAHGEGP